MALRYFKPMEDDLMATGVNQMGPHFSKGLPIIYSWIYGAKTEQPGEKYMLWPSGLQKPPVVEVSQGASVWSHR